METRYILPLATATALHAFVFLGLEWSHPPVAATAATQVKKIDPLFEVDLTPPEETSELTEAGSPQPKGEPETFEPKQEESFTSDSIFKQPVERTAPTPLDVTTRISAGPVGVWDGVEGAPPNNLTVLSHEALDRQPRFRSRVPPTYTAAEKNAGITGEVLVEFEVDESGRVSKAQVVRSSHAGFEQSTLRAVLKWRFESGTKHGQPVRFRMVVPVQFSLNS
jgi:protein TonB